MEPTALDIQRTGDLGGTKVAMKFDENSIAHIMSVLTDLYSDPAMAVIREYSTNAWDSHIAAGQQRPIEVILPAQFSPFFKVKDYGVGLSVDDISDIYSKYGASTKRGTNDQVGMLGLGCKSALTFAPQFTLVGIKNGVKATVAISRMEDGTGVMEIVDTCTTTEPNGVEVVIPARFNQDFINKAMTFYSYWSPGSVLVNGKVPPTIEGQRVTKDLIMVKGRGQDVVVMGNVAYPLKDANALYARDYYANFHIVAYVPIGSVNFTPSREQLHYTSHTNATIAKVNAEFTAALAKSITNDIQGALNHANALTALVKWESLVGRTLPKGITYKGDAIPTDFKIDGGDGILFYPNRSRGNTDYIKQVNYKMVNNHHFIVGFPSDKPSSDQRSKIRAFADANNLTGNWILTDKPFGEPWITKTYDWATIRKSARTIRKASSGLRFSVYDPAAQRFKDTDEIDTSTTIVYFSPADYKYCPWGSVAIADEVTLVSLGKNRWDKFKRDFPEAIMLHTHLRTLEKEVVDNLTEADRIALGLDYYAKSMLSKLDPSKIDDPDVVRFIGLAKNDPAITPGVKKWNAMANLLKGFTMRATEVAIPSNPLVKYPLIQGHNVQAHTYLYMNAVYNG